MATADLNLPRDPLGQVPCKCCESPAPFAGSIDFAKSTEPLQQPSGVLVHYYRCARCGFLFTTSFDHFTHDDFARHIYNEQYAAVDPDYLDKRPRENAQLIADAAPLARELPILDYGGGNSRTAEYLRGHGFRQVDVYDPFVPGFSRRPDRRYDFVLCFEVFEHVPDPRRLMSDLAALTSDRGVVYFTTLLQPRGLRSLDWWYIAPRNGHVSFYTVAALGVLASAVRMRGYSRDQLRHFLYHTEIPPFTSDLVG